MKRCFLSLVLVCLMVGAGCEDDDSPGSVVGRWLLTNTVFDGAETDETFGGTRSWVLDLQSDGTFSITETISAGSGDTTGTWTTSGDQITLSYDIIGAASGTFTYSLDGDTMTFRTDIGNSTYVMTMQRL